MKTIIYKIFSEKTISIFAVIVSFFALGLSYIQLSDSRKHNQLSLRPIIQVIHNLSYTPDSTKGIFHIHNDGVGPAIFTGATISLNGKVINKPELEAWKEVFKQVDLGDMYICLELGTLKGSSLPPGADFPILRIRDPKIIPGLSNAACEAWVTQAQIVNLLKDVKIDLHYESVYKEPFETSSRTVFD